MRDTCTFVHIEWSATCEKDGMHADMVMDT